MTEAKKRKLFLESDTAKAPVAAPAAASAADAILSELAATADAAVCGCGVVVTRENGSKSPKGVWTHIGCGAKAPSVAPTQAPEVLAPPASAPPFTARYEYEDEREGTPYTAVVTLEQVTVSAPPLAALAAQPQPLPPAAAPASLPPAAAAPTVAAALSLPASKAKPPKTPRAKAPKAPVVGWYASAGAGRWGPFTSQLEAFEGSVLPANLAGYVAAELAAGRPPTYQGMPLVNVGAVGVPKWLPLGLVVYPERL